MKRSKGHDPEGERDEWDALFEKTLPLKRRPGAQDTVKRVPAIVNVVATATFLPPGYTLPMKQIARSLRCTQYAPRMFAANICRFLDSISACTALIFSTGCVVVVSLRSENHARYTCQFLRTLLEAVRCVLRASEPVHSLTGRLRFDRCEIHNIVGKGDFGHLIDLQAMCDAAPSNTKWFKDSFPGLECKVWLTPSYTCVCGRPPGHKVASGPWGGGEGPGQRKCSCAVKLLIFSTGQYVITGARRLQDVNAVSFRVSALAGKYKALENTAQEHHLGGGGGGKRGNVKKSLKPDTAVAAIMAGAPMLPTPNGEVMPPFMQMALAGRVEIVTRLFLMDPDAAQERDSQGRTTAQRLEAIPPSELGPERKQILEMLK